MEVMITITGIKHYIDVMELQPKQEVLLKKDFNNKYDLEAIAVYLNESMQIGYVANSIHTQAKGTYSSGRLYDKITDDVKAKILVVLHDSAIAVVDIDK